MSNETFDFFLSCPVHCEELLKAELKQFNIEPRSQRNGGVFINVSFDQALRVMLFSRVASRIHYRVGIIDFKHEEQISKEVARIPWETFFAKEKTIRINAIKSRQCDRIKNPFFCGLKVKDGICDRFLDKKGSRPSVDTTEPQVQILLYIDKSNRGYTGELYFDISGSLAHRGYRASGHRAPLRENLAAAIILSTNWDKEETMLDLMCGSGTFLIEAAMIKGDLPPSYIRVHNGESYPIENYSFFKKNPNWTKTYNKLRKQVEDKYQAGLAKLKQSDYLHGIDNSIRALTVAEECIRNAQLNEVIVIRKEDALEYVPEQVPGITICNPPYGERMSDVETLENLYYNLGEHLKNNYKGARAFIFTANPALRKKISLRTERRIPFFNGPLEARLLEYNLF